MTSYKTAEEYMAHANGAHEAVVAVQEEIASRWLAGFDAADLDELRDFVYDLKIRLAQYALRARDMGIDRAQSAEMSAPKFAVGDRVRIDFLNSAPVDTVLWIERNAPQPFKRDLIDFVSTEARVLAVEPQFDAAKVLRYAYKLDDKSGRCGIWWYETALRAADTPRGGSVPCA